MIDTSALVAILTGEPERDRMLELIADDERRFVSTCAVTEASMLLENRYGPEAGRLLDELLQRARVKLVAFDEEQAAAARDAFRRYGRGRHKAGLNFGDCICYAAARMLGEPLLCKGDDFVHTDVLISR